MATTAATAMRTAFQRAPLRPDIRNSLLISISGPLRPSGAFQSRTSPTQPTKRFESSNRRMRKKLNIPPAPAHGGPTSPLGATGRSKTARSPLPQDDHIIFNPPPSAPNVYHTPAKFLPRDDVRWKLYDLERQNREASLAAEAAATAATAAMGPDTVGAAEALKAHKDNSKTGSSSGFSSTASVRLPPAVRKPYVKSYHVTPDQIEEIRRLRMEDEDDWTVNKLAQRFQCSTVLIMNIVKASPARKQKLEEEKQIGINNWRRRGTASPRTREARRRRQALWGLEA